jgi:hypothetical protein
VSASRPCGRCAVGLRPSLDPDTTLARSTTAEKIQKINGQPELTYRVATDKQGSRLVRWAAVEAVQRVSGHTRLGQTRDRIGERRGRNIGVVAAARELITLVFYGLRDHHIRCLPAPATAAAAAALSESA